MKACDGWVAIEEAAPAIRRYMEAQQDEMVGLLQALALAESPSDAPESHRRVFDRLTEGLSDAGYAVRRVPGPFSPFSSSPHPSRLERETDTDMV